MKDIALCIANLSPLFLRRFFYSIAGFRKVGKLSIAKKVYSDFPSHVIFGETGHVGRGCEFHIGYGNTYILIEKTYL